MRAILALARAFVYRILIFILLPHSVRSLGFSNSHWALIAS